MAGKGTRGATERSEMIITLTQLLNEKIDPINNKLEKLDSIETSVGFALDELKKLTDLEITVKQLSSNLNKVDQELKEVKAENKLLKDKLIKQERYTRRNNLKLWGLKVTKTEDIETKVIHTLQESGVAINARDIERIHFAGPATSNRPRPILMKCNNYKVKMSILDKKGTLKERNINISDDYPREILDRRQLIVPIFFKALEVCSHLKPKLRDDSIILGGKEYTVDNILSTGVQELCPERIFTPSHNGITAFFTKHSPLSNHFPVQFQCDGQLFHSSEQHFMYQKAVFFKDGESARQILETNSPVEARNIGKKIANYDGKVWNNAAEDCMFKAMYSKFSQDQYCAKFLRQTKGTQLAEANPGDTHWGTGTSLRNKDSFNPDKWRGKNIAGMVLSRVRQTLG